MPRLIIPTRNRSSSLFSVLNYLQTFYPGTQVIVADGSADDYKAKNQQAIANFPDIEVSYRAFDYDLGFFDRILAVLETEPDENFIMGADDDYPVMDVLTRAERILTKNNEYCAVIGPSVKMTLQADNKLNARLVPARQLSHATVEKRVSSFANWSFQTSYGVARKEFLIERYKVLRDHFLVGFVDFSIGVLDCMYGKLRAIPEFTYFRTAHFNGSYLRPDKGLVFLRRRDEVVKLMELFTDKLVNRWSMERDEAQHLCEMLFRERIAELCGRGRLKLSGFASSSLFNNSLVQEQYQMFHNLFEADNEIRARYEEQLKFISSAIRENALSDDNKGESKKVEYLQGTTGNL